MIKPEDQHHYSQHYLRFVAAHREAFDAAYLDGNSQAARPEMERLAREFHTLPPRHACACWPMHCAECARIAKWRLDPPDIVIGRSGARSHPPTPMTTLLDINAGYAA